MEIEAAPPERGRSSSTERNNKDNTSKNRKNNDNNDHNSSHTDSNTSSMVASSSIVPPSSSIIPLGDSELAAIGASTQAAQLVPNKSNLVRVQQQQLANNNTITDADSIINTSSMDYSSNSSSSSSLLQQHQQEKLASIQTNENSANSGNTIDTSTNAHSAIPLLSLISSDSTISIENQNERLIYEMISAKSTIGSTNQLDNQRTSIFELKRLSRLAESSSSSSATTSAYATTDAATHSTHAVTHLEKSDGTSPIVNQQKSNLAPTASSTPPRHIQQTTTTVATASAADDDGAAAAASASASTLSKHQLYSNKLRAVLKPSTAHPQTNNNTGNTNRNNSNNINDSNNTDSNQPTTKHYDPVCHCLVTSSGSIQQQPDSAASKLLFDAIPQEGPNTEAAAKKLLPAIPADQISTAYFTPGHHSKDELVLHINFMSLDALSTALSSYPWLNRCGASGKENVWSASKRCAATPDRAKIPELLQFTCKPSQAAIPPAQENVDAAIKAALTEMKLDGCDYWVKKDPHNNKQGGVSIKFTINVLLRNAKQLSDYVEQLHNKVILFGQKLRSSAPNTPALHRCNQCEKLGHVGEGCPLYSGIAIRLLFKQPMPWSFVITNIKPECHATTCFLGSNIDDHAPSRRCTLLYAHKKDAVAQEDDIIDLLTPLLQKLSSVIDDVYSMPITNRTRECKECGSMDRDHSCKFRVENKLHAAYAKQQATYATQAAAAAGMSRTTKPTQGNASSSASSSASTFSSNDRMCKSWREHKVCPRKDKGETCVYEHPESHKAEKPQQVCYSWNTSKYCHRGKACRFAHNANNQTAGVSSVPVGDNNTGTSSSSAATAAATTAAPGSLSVATRSSSANSSSASATSNRYSLLTDSMQVDDDEDDSSAPAASSNTASAAAAATTNSAPPSVLGTLFSPKKPKISHTTSTTASAAPNNGKKRGRGAASTPASGGHLDDAGPSQSSASAAASSSAAAAASSSSSRMDESDDSQ